MTPLDIRVKEYMRQYLNGMMSEEKAKTANMATGFVIRGVDIERILDSMWVYMNRKLIESKNEDEKKK